MAVSSYTLAISIQDSTHTLCHFPSHIVHVSSHPTHSNHPVLAPSAGNVCLSIPTHTNRSPHAAIREDVTGNLTALEELTAQVTPPPELLFCESGGDNLAANFSRELADYTIYVIDVAGGDKVPRKGGPGITQSDLLVRGCRCWSMRTMHVLQRHIRAHRVTPHSCTLCDATFVRTVGRHFDRHRLWRSSPASLSHTSLYSLMLFAYRWFIFRRGRVLRACSTHTFRFASPTWWHNRVISDGSLSSDVVAQPCDIRWFTHQIWWHNRVISDGSLIRQFSLTALFFSFFARCFLAWVVPGVVCACA
jgi:hypothetical protein